MKAYTAAGLPDEVKAADETSPPDCNVGDLVATLSAPNPLCSTFWLSQVRIISPPDEPDIFITDYDGTQNGKVFRPVFVDSRDRKLILSQKDLTRKGSVAHITRYSGREPLANIIASHLTLTHGGHLTSSSQDILTGFTPETIS